MSSRKTSSWVRRENSTSEDRFLLGGLPPQFYQKNLGDALGNQMWLVTHSDALLREVVGRDNFNVFHMLPCGNVPEGEGQLKPLAATADLELAIVDLVGDLASYRPGGKVVIFEGGGDSDFDQRVTATLFPELQLEANLISGSNKVRVRALHETLETAAQKGQLPFQFFSITDRDSGAEPLAPNAYASVNTFSWEVYHIENYFLVPQFINRVLESLGEKPFPDDQALSDELRQCAQDTLTQLVRHELSAFVNKSLVSAIDTSTDPAKQNIAGLLSASIERSSQRISALKLDLLSEAALATKEQKIREKYVESLANGSWVNVFRGRDILKAFKGKHAKSVSYEVFRNLILASMKDHGYSPLGMKKVVETILSC